MESPDIVPAAKLPQRGFRNPQRHPQPGGLDDQLGVPLTKHPMITCQEPCDIVLVLAILLRHWAKSVKPINKDSETKKAQ